jgi:hypothetical protein
MLYEMMRYFFMFNYFNMLPFLYLHVELRGESTRYRTSNQTRSSRGSWSPGDHTTSVASKDRLLTKLGEVGICRSSCPDHARTLSFHIDDYLHLRQSEDLLLETWMQKERIVSGGLVLCSRSTIL